MINARNNLRNRNTTAEINISPLIDLVFLLLIFFMVTTSFVKETGIDVQRPSAMTATVKPKAGIMVGVDSENRIFMNKKEIDVRSVRSHIARCLAEKPEGAVIIVADRESDTGTVIKVMDQCRLAGAPQVSIAASKDGVQ